VPFTRKAHSMRFSSCFKGVLKKNQLGPQMHVWSHKFDCATKSWIPGTSCVLSLLTPAAPMARIQAVLQTLFDWWNHYVYGAVAKKKVWPPVDSARMHVVATATRKPASQNDVVTNRGISLMEETWYATIANSYIAHCYPYSCGRWE